MTDERVDARAPEAAGAAPVTVEAKLDAILQRLTRIEERLDTQPDGLAAELGGPVRLAMAGMTDEMIKGMVRRVATLAEVALDPQVLDLLERMRRPDVIATFERLTDPQVLEVLRGATSTLALVQSGLADEMVTGLVKKLAVVGEMLLDPFVLDALQTLARALKAGQSQYPDVKVPPVGGVFAALRAANDPDTRRALAFALAVAKNLGAEFR